MQRRILLAISLLTILTFSWQAVIAHASLLTYTVHGDSVSVELSLQFFQNATAMPSVNEAFSGLTAENLTSALEESLSARTKGVSVSSLTGSIRSTSDWVNTTIRFDLAGISARRGDLLNVNCSWVRFRVSKDLRVGNLSYNLIGGAYVRPVFERYVGFEKTPLNDTIREVAYQLGGADTDSAFAVQRAGNTTLLDFSNLVPPIENWNRTYDLVTSSTAWTYDTAPALDLTMIVFPIDGPQFSAQVFYKYNATFSVNGLAQAQADTIVTDVSGGLEPALMLLTVLVIFVLAVVVSWTYRSRRRQLPRRR
jgi:hypothetical protein